LKSNNTNLKKEIKSYHIAGRYRQTEGRQGREMNKYQKM
jgi:hypothetical protein